MLLWSQWVTKSTWQNFCFIVFHYVLSASLPSGSYCCRGRSSKYGILILWTTYFSVRVFVCNATESLSHSRSLEFCHLRVVHYSSEEISIWAFEIRYAELFTPSTEYIKVTGEKMGKSKRSKKIEEKFGKVTPFLFLCEIKTNAFPVFSMPHFKLYSPTKYFGCWLHWLQYTIYMDPATWKEMPNPRQNRSPFYPGIQDFETGPELQREEAKYREETRRTHKFMVLPAARYFSNFN